MTDGAACFPAEHVVFTDLDGVEAVLVDLDTKQYFTLNETARLVWSVTAEGRSADAIVERMTQAFEVSPEHARRSVAAALEKFVTLGLMVRR